MSEDAVQTLPAGGGRRSRRDAPIGGQAVLEGVMMRGVSTWAVAVRKPAPEQVAEGRIAERGEVPRGEIEVVSEPLVSWIRRHRLLRLPIVRGVVALASRSRSGSAPSASPPAPRWARRTRRSGAEHGPAR